MHKRRGKHSWTVIPIPDTWEGAIATRNRNTLFLRVALPVFAAPLWSLRLGFPPGIPPTRCIQITLLWRNQECTQTALIKQKCAIKQGGIACSKWYNQCKACMKDSRGILRRGKASHNKAAYEMQFRSLGYQFAGNPVFLDPSNFGGAMKGDIHIVDYLSHCVVEPRIAT